VTGTSTPASNRRASLATQCSSNDSSRPDNAVRYTRANGDIWITTGKNRSCDGDTSDLTVTNTGTHLSAADTANIFKPFHRLSNRTDPEGFGLSLTIVASIAALHGGTASAQSRDAGGLTVTVILPATSDDSHTTTPADAQ
jgi:signal transduction histidine kinase